MNPYSELWLAEAHLAELRREAGHARRLAATRGPNPARRRLADLLVALAVRLADEPTPPRALAAGPAHPDPC